MAPEFFIWKLFQIQKSHKTEPNVFCQRSEGNQIEFNFDVLCLKWLKGRKEHLIILVMNVIESTINVNGQDNV